MNFNFAEAIAALGPDAAVRIANQARPNARRLFATILPERNMTDYSVNAANMVVRTTMAGLASMDSPYPPGGAVQISTFLEESAKLAIENTLPEGALRQLQSLFRQMMIDGTLTNDFLQREALNFLQKVIVQALLDTSEWLRAQALIYGLIDWQFNQKTLSVDYGIPAANKLTTRTDSNNDSYSDSGSAFWTDVVAAQELLRFNMRAAILNTATLFKIIGNSANNIEIVSQSNTVVEVVRLVSRAGNTLRDSDSRYRMRFFLYDEEAEVLDTTAATLGQTQRIKFVPDGKILYLGANTESGYRVGQGSTDNPQNDLELGYTHLAPTVEGGGRPGRWSRLFTPEGYPMQLKGQGVSNELPVILNPDKIVIATTEMAP